MWGFHRVTPTAFSPHSLALNRIDPAEVSLVFRFEPDGHSIFNAE
jgi:hypothetical protein